MTTTAPTATALDLAVAEYVRKGYTVDDRQPAQVVLSRKKKVSALGLLLWVALAVCTVGLILIVPAVRLANRKRDVIVLTLDARGKVRVSKGK